MKTLFTGLAPNVERDDARLSLSLIMRPAKWVQGTARQKLEARFLDVVPVKHAIAFSTGRSALWAILSALNLAEGSEVLMQAYTCVAVPDPVLWAGTKPVYVDIDPETLNMSPADLRKKITKNARVLIIQHTLGLPAEIDELMKVAREHNLFVIEDCAHALGAEYKRKQIGTFGDAAFFSFGRDKVISSVFGGMATARDDKLAEDIRRIQASRRPAPRWWVLQQLLYAPITHCVRRTYDMLGLGKLSLWFSQKLHILSKSVYPEERRGGKPSFVDGAMPNALAELAIKQLKKLERFNTHRSHIAEIYKRELQRAPSVGAQKTDGRIYLRYNVYCKNPERIRSLAKQEKIFLGDWYTTAVAPKDTLAPAICYTSGSAKNAEARAHETINLPTDIHISPDDARRIAAFINQHCTL